MSADARRSLPVIVARIEALHRTVDELTAPLVLRHAEHITCKRGCAECCVDELTVLPVEAERIRARYAALLREGTPSPMGACAFLGEARECRIYDARPYVCRTQGLPLRWIAEVEERTDEGDVVTEIVEERDVCALNFAEGPSVAELANDACWAIGPVEDALVSLSEQSGLGSDRVALRSMFSKRG